MRARFTAKATGQATTNPPSSGSQKRASPRPASIASGTSTIVRLSITSMTAIETVSAASTIGATVASGMPEHSSGTAMRAYTATNARPTASAIDAALPHPSPSR